MAEQTLRHLKADILFLGVEGIDARIGVSTPNLLEAQLNRVMVEMARYVVAVCDVSRFGRSSLSTIVPISAIHQVITDKTAPKSHLQELRESGIKVLVV